MNLLSWNYRGIGKPRTVQVLRDLVTHQPNLLFLSKTLELNNKVEELASKLGFINCFSVGRQGRGGGLLVMWKQNMICSVVDSSQNHVDIEIVESADVKWRLSYFY